MTNKTNNPINTLIFSSSANDCEELASQLKNQGLAIRQQQIDNSERLSEQLNKKAWQLAIFLEDLNNLPIKQAMLMLNKQSNIIPSLYLSKNYSEQQRLEMMQLGLNDCLSDEDIDLLGLIIKREQKLVLSETDSLNATKLLSETSKRNELLLDSSKDAIAYIAEGMHIYTNPTYSERFGYDNDDLVALTIMDLIGSNDTDSLKSLLKQQAQSSEEIEQILHGKRHDGTEFEANFIVSSAVYDDEPCIQLLVREVGDQTELMEKLKEVSSIDQVTGLLNRPAFLKKLNKSVKQSQDSGIDALLYFVEIDEFQNLQNQFGIAACDELLTGVGHWLKEKTTNASEIGRISDSSFSVLLTDSEALPSELARTLCDGIKETSFEVTGQTVNITLSIGTVSTTENQLEAGKLLAQANAFCNKVKADGGDGFKVFNPTVDTLLNDKERAIYDEFLAAKEAGDIRVLYQPMMPLKGSSNRQYLSFFRYLNSEGEMTLAPGLFDVFEKLGIDDEIDRLSIKTALKELANKEKDKRLKLFVKLSPSTLVRDDLIEWLLDKIEKTEIETNQFVLCIEAVTTQSYINRVTLLREALADCDIGLCINNIGLADKELIALIKPNYITLSGEIMDTILEEGPDKVIKLTNTAQKSNTMTIVTKLEAASSLAQIWPLGVDFAMGNYVSTPIEHMNYDFTENDF